ncbi:MAG: hypothetical protein C0626_09905 [Arcobacter sp.]|uniref:hypothetical protein n=1 Tax=uncultured Arcobacter sp. TaxID=165434 RepID=UPI000CB6B5A3|nr:hypothetical protein [uncultured Arcobacter sp.]PLY09299.1 MAG: hypothetical protein C0626_09905 [Arcobacter sp.]
MKIKFLLITIATIITFASSSFLLQDKKIDEKLYSTIINTSINNLSGVFKIDSKTIIKKLNDNNIKILNEEQTIIQIALSNAKNSNEIIDLILSH